MGAVVLVFQLVSYVHAESTTTVTSSKWNHDNLRNVVATFVGVGNSDIVCFIHDRNLSLSEKEKKVVPPTTTRQTPHQTSNTEDVELEI